MEIKNDILIMTNYNDISSDGLLIIPNNVKRITSGACTYQSNLKKVIIPDSVVKIYPDTFMMAKNLEEVYLSKNLEIIPGGRNSLNLFKQI